MRSREHFIGVHYTNEVIKKCLQIQKKQIIRNRKKKYMIPWQILGNMGVAGTIEYYGSLPKGLKLCSGFFGDFIS